MMLTEPRLETIKKYESNTSSALLPLTDSKKRRIKSALALFFYQEMIFRKTHNNLLKQLYSECEDVDLIFELVLP